MKKFFLFVVFLFVLLLAACLPFLLRLDHYRAQIATDLSQRLNRKVVIGRLEAVIFPPAMRFREVAIMNPAGDAALLHVDEILAPIGLAGLFKGQTAPKTLNLRGWTATVHRHPNGTWAWDEWIDPATHVAEKAGWPLQVITFDRGECHAVDPYGPAPQEFVIQVQQGAWESARQYTSINGILTSLPVPVSFLFQGTGHFIAHGNWTGVLDLSDENRHVKWDIKVAGDHAEAAGRSDPWRFDTAYAFLRFYGRLPVAPVSATPSALLQGWESHFDWQASTLSFTQNATLAGGRAEANGSIVSQATLPVARIDLALQNAKVQPLEAVLFGSSPLEGTVTALAHIDVALSLGAWSTLNGQGALDVKDGQYYLPGSSTQGLMKAHTMRYVLKKFPGFLASGLPFSKAAAHWQIRRGMLSFDDAFCRLGDIQVASVGQYDIPRNGLDAYVRVQVHEKNPALLNELPPSYVDKGEGKPQIQPMHGHIQGTPSEWHLRAVRVSKIPARVLSKLSRAIHSPNNPLSRP